MSRKQCGTAISRPCFPTLGWVSTSRPEVERTDRLISKSPSQETPPWPSCWCRGRWGGAWMLIVQTDLFPVGAPTNGVPGGGPEAQRADGAPPAGHRIPPDRCAPRVRSRSQGPYRLFSPLFYFFGFHLFLAQIFVRLFSPLNAWRLLIFTSIHFLKTKIFTSCKYHNPR